MRGQKKSQSPNSHKALGGPYSWGEDVAGGHSYVFIDLDGRLIFQIVFDEQERAISLVHQHANGANPKQSTHCLHNTPTHAAIKQQWIPALFDCVSAYFLTRLTVWAKKGVHPGEETNRWQRMRYLPL
jgi:hypothetical protein